MIGHGLFLKENQKVDFNLNFFKDLLMLIKGLYGESLGPMMTSILRLQAEKSKSQLRYGKVLIEKINRPDN